MNNLIELKNVSKYYFVNKKNLILKKISYKFKKGLIYSLVGPSGSGKSTLLNLLSLIDKPSSGEIIVNNNAIKYNNVYENDENDLCATGVRAVSLEIMVTVIPLSGCEISWIRKLTGFRSSRGNMSKIHKGPPFNRWEIIFLEIWDILILLRSHEIVWNRSLFVQKTVIFDMFPPIAFPFEVDSVVGCEKKG